jgi:adenosylcobinamide-phosphate synthase
MITPVLFASAYAIDWLVGDPRWLPHPVRWMGRMIGTGEWLLRWIVVSPSGEFTGGLLLTVVTVGLFGLGSWQLLRLLELWNPVIAFGMSLYLATTTLATRSLLDEARLVRRFLADGDLVSARHQVGRIVGRDTQDLDEPEVARAAIETLAESACDGIVAPMFYLAIGGVPAALAYKAVNTLDSVIGHHGERYEYFGKFAARLDDVANFVPARLTGLLFVVTSWLFGLDWRGALSILKRDGSKHKSPNAGRPEAAMAGALGVRLGGTNFYGGEAHVGQLLGDANKRMDIWALRNALRLTAGVSLLTFILCFAARLLVFYI